MFMQKAFLSQSDDLQAADCRHVPSSNKNDPSGQSQTKVPFWKLSMHTLSALQELGTLGSQRSVEKRCDSFENFVVVGLLQIRPGYRLLFAEASTKLGRHLQVYLMFW